MIFNDYIQDWLYYTVKIVILKVVKDIQLIFIDAVFISTGIFVSLWVFFKVSRVPLVTDLWGNRSLSKNRRERL